MRRDKPTTEDERDEIYAPLTAEELKRSLAKRTGRFGHHIQIDLPIVNHQHPQNKKPKGLNPPDSD